MSLATQFQRLRKRVVAFRQEIFAEEITIGIYTIPAEVTAPTLESDFVSGGEYQKAQLVALVQAADLPTGFIPTAQMDVTARGLDLRIAPDGITRHLHAWRLVFVARNVPR